MWSHILTFLGGAAVATFAPLFLPSLVAEAVRRSQARTAAKRVVALQLDPLLKAADELHGKLLSLAKEDFRDFKAKAIASKDYGDLIKLCSVLYLFAQMWARLEILRLASLHAELTADRRGGAMLRFARCLESKHVRLVDRAWQRAIAESIIVGAGGTLEIRPFKSFVDEYETSEALRRWFEPLAQMLTSSSNKRIRQRVLRYGVVVHAMIDTLDPKHHTSKPRPGYPNKLSRRSRKDLIGRTFGVYLTNVRPVEKYVASK